MNKRDFLRYIVDCVPKVINKPQNPKTPHDSFDN
jgi:hypothetical protein